MAATRYNSADYRRQMGSPRPKNRDMKDTMCRNILIYGHCRYEDVGCTFNHDQSKKASPKIPQTEPTSAKKPLNVESAPFTPGGGASQQPLKKTFSSSHAASAAVFTPRNPAAAATAGSPQQAIQDSEGSTPAPTGSSGIFNNIAAIREFQPQNYDLTANGAGAGSHDAGLGFDPFSMGNVLPPAANQYNPYANDHAGLVNHGAAYYPSPSGWNTMAHQPIQSHLYAPIGPYRDDLQPWQRSTYDFFMSEKLRDDLHKKSHAALQVMPPGQHQLPSLDSYHSLVPLDKVAARKTTSIFKYTSWAYKATSSKTGRLYCLRRLEGFKLSTENVLRPIKEWKKISNGNIVTTHDAFTTRAFGESSLMFAQDYHPLSDTLAEHHFASLHTSQFKRPIPVTENVLWGYIVQIANALKAIHSANLAARCIDISKIILTDKNRIRLSACGFLDVVQYDNRKPLAELQQEDFVSFGKVVVSLATNTLPSHLNLKTALEQLSRNHSVALKETAVWLLTPPAAPTDGDASTAAVPTKSVENLLSGINHHVIAAFDSQLHRSDSLNSELFREVENGRIARLLLKLGTINERQEYEADPHWSENGDRYMLKLFRDYVFHQVDATGAPVLDIGHMLRCINKLDVGTDERIRLTSREGETDFIVTYKELNRAVAGAFGELLKSGSRGPAVGGPAERGSGPLQGHSGHHQLHRTQQY